MESTVLTTSFVTLVCLFVFLEGFKCSEGIYIPSFVTKARLILFGSLRFPIKYREFKANFSPRRDFFVPPSRSINSER